MPEAVCRVAYLGPEGTFSQQATALHFGDSAQAEPVASIDDVFLEVEAGRINQGVVPVENSTEGAVTVTQECLIDTSLYIVAEIYVPIVHCFLLAQAAQEQEVRQVVSHRQSLAQCRHWLREHFPGVAQHAVSSNAEAARLAAEDPGTGAIAGELAARQYGLRIVHEGIQDRSNNTTRFLVLSRETVPPSGHDKSSILVYTENRPGSLLRVLEPFDRHQVSLTRIETRPARDGIWDYVFFIDFEGHREDPAVKQVFSELAECTVQIKWLGSYPMVLESQA